MKAFSNIQLTVSEMGQVRAINEINTGMDLRDYFAAKAMSMIPYPSPLNEYNEKHFQDYMKKASNFCYQIADEMMEARKK